MIAAVYIRKSREDKNKPSHRLTVQREQLPAYALAQGWQVEIYDDGHASAARGKVEELHERARLESDVRSGKINLILVIELSRLSRDDSLQDYVSWLYLCSQHGVKLATPSRQLDPSQHSDWMLLLMEGGFSSVEMKVLQARMAEGRAEAYRAGKWLSGNPPMPYKYDRGAGGLIVDPDQMPTFRKMMRLAELYPASQVADRVGIPSVTVRRAISDDRLLMYQGARRDPDSGATIDGQWPAVIDHLQAERIRRNRGSRRKAPRRQYAAMLSNLDILTCGYCGHSYRAWKNGRTRVDGTRLDYYGCRHKDKSDACQSRMIPTHILEERVLTNLFGLLSKAAELQRAWEARQDSDDTPGKLADIDREIEKCHTKKQRLVEAVADGLLSPADVRQKRNEIDNTIGTLNQKRAGLLSAQAIAPDWDALKITRQAFDHLYQAEQREVIASLIAQIRIFPTYALITYRFPRNENGDNIARIHLPERQKPAGPRQVYKVKKQ
ncbi:recombinase family protein [Syntrophotalea acetylenica]|uniref:Resolvase/invertase-type recombinase catalytic domain-containing protein n=1 Tax=Syntrophotalea acetylenica TaxID=29542 RepID=A0A1L3GDP0_SYNAC|nr:recombinase family protein [Syntrophotalea acetylenica]APG24066.1 hypothetical protein A7E75_02760 [Syntrophotalea acetylenica]APG44648.1 hypothetical protein A6070_11385 [Syntrophotalea acetylenica]APG45448.1 hypothetical protein A6070_14810 [Syntrophotalea acetylenica]